MLKAKVEGPFTVYRVLPRVAVSFSDTSLVSLDVGGNLLTYEMDLSLDFFVFFRDLVSVTVLSAMYIPLLHSYNLTLNAHIRDHAFHCTYVGTCLVLVFRQCVCVCVCVVCVCVRVRAAFEKN